MRLVLCGITAYEFWRSSLSIVPPDFRGFLNTSKLTDFLHDTCADVNKLLVNTGGSLSTDLHLLVESQQERRIAPHIFCHSVPAGTRLPKGSIYQISDEIAVVSPGLCFLQLVSELDDLALARAGCDLTALYRRDATRNRDLIQLDDAAFTKQDLLDYLASVPDYRGAKHAMRIASWVLDRARSPREVSMAMLMNMPTKAGGYGFPDLKANQVIQLSDELQALARREHLECDILLPNGDMLEYNSSTHHDTDEELEFDFEKIATLQTMQRTVIPVSTRQFNDFDKFDTIMRGVNSRLGIRRKAGDSVLARRRGLHEQLLNAEKAQRFEENLVDTARWRLVVAHG